MGLVLCSRHGDSVLAFVSPKLADLCRLVRPAPEPVARVTLDVLGTISRHPVDKEFALSLTARFGLAAGSLQIPAGESSLEVLAELVPICSGCLADWLARNGG